MIYENDPRANQGSGGMNYFSLLNALIPEAGNIEKAIQTFRALEANTDVQTALATAQRVAAILKKAQTP